MLTYCVLKPLALGSSIRHPTIFFFDRNGALRAMNKTHGLGTSRKPQQYQGRNKPKTRLQRHCRRYSSYAVEERPFTRIFLGQKVLAISRARVRRNGGPRKETTAYQRLCGQVSAHTCRYKFFFFAFLYRSKVVARRSVLTCYAV